MIVEVVAVGTELLLGQIVNGNAATIGARLAEHGFDVHFSQMVGDNLDRVAEALRLAMGRSQAVIVTGGIGPTQDDLTREAICAATGRAMLRNQEYAEALRERFRSLGREMSPSNLQQADHPEGAEQLANPKGTAPGLALEHEGTWLFAVPGVPEEMSYLLDTEILPRLRRIAGIDRVLVSRVIRTWGLAESKVADLVDDLYRATTNPSIAFLASKGEIKVRVTAAAATGDEARRLIAPVEVALVERLGSTVFGFDDDTIEPVLLRMLGEKGWTIGTAESATGGLVAGRLTSVPGSSAVFRGSLVAYASDLKGSLLGVDVSHGVVSEQAALEMASGARTLLGVDVAVAVTGSAGPDPQELPAGTMVLAVETPEGARARTMRLPGDRERVRTYTATAALHLVRLAVTGTWWSR